MGKGRKGGWSRIARFGLVFATLAVAALLVAAATLPYWMGWAWGWVANDLGVRYESYERTGYARFALSDVAWQGEGVAIRAERIEALMPFAWAYEVWRGESGEPFVEIGSLELEISEADTPAEAAPQLDPVALFELLETPIATASFWVPKARIEQVDAIFQERRIEVAALKWESGSIAFSIRSDPFNEFAWEVAATLARRGVEITLRQDDLDIVANSELWIEKGILAFQSDVARGADRFTSSARWDRSGWLPIDARWRAEDWAFAGSTFGDEILYESYLLSLSGSWDGTDFQSEISGVASETVDPNRPLPPLRFQSEVTGDTQGARIESLTLEGPGIRLDTSDGLDFDYATASLKGELRSRIEFDLSLLEIDGLAGSLSGDAFLGANTDGKPKGAFALEGEGISFRESRSQRIEMELELDWPQASISRLETLMEDGSTLSASGDIDLEGKRVESSSYEIRLSEQTLAAALPTGMRILSANAVGEANGPFENLYHAGAWTVEGLETEIARPLAATIDWVGEGMRIERLETIIDNGVMRLEAMAAFDGTSRARLERLSIGQEGAVIARLQEPTAFELRTGDRIGASLGDLRLIGPQFALRARGVVDFPSSGDIRIELEGARSETLIDPWIKTPIPTSSIESGVAAIRWADGPLEADIEIDGSIAWGEESTRLSGTFAIGENGLSLNSIAVSDMDGPLFEASGELPYSIDFSREPPVVADKGKRLSLVLSTKESPTLARAIGSVSPLSVKRFEANANLSGTLTDPRGSIALRFETEEGEGAHGLPSAVVSGEAQLDGRSVRIDTLSASVLEEVFEANLEVRLPEGIYGWATLEPAEVNWMETDLRFVAPPTKFAPIAFFAPEIFAPAGSLEAHISGSPEKGFSGFFQIYGVGTRPIFPFGSFRNLSTKVDFQGECALLSAFRGEIGREPIELTGEIDYGNPDDLSFEFAALGERLPVLRRAGLLLRSDIDLKASKKRGEDAIIKGTVTLKDGLLLLDTTALRSSGGGQSAETRPPYFSVDTEPFASWKADIAVTGERFLRLQTPAATGFLSIDMALQGTLEEPIALGRVEFDQGSLIFPFASFGLTEGLIEIRKEDPYTPMLSLFGETRRFRHDLGLEITGSAYDPSVRFVSSPPLASDEILLMVMTGDVPDSDFAYSASQRASKIGSYLSQGLFSSGGQSGIGSRLSLETGANLSEQGKETMDIEFKIDERFQLLGEYDEYDEWNAGLRWRVLRRRAISEAEEGDSQ